MPCYHPIPAWKPQDLDAYGTKSGKPQLVFRPELGLASTKIEVPCGQCIGCRIERSRQWAVRCVHEASLHKKNCFLTLTYSERNIPSGGTLKPDDIQKFLKRLRFKYKDQTIRFFQCGEYGEELQRPHHHILLFGFDFPDKVPYGKNGKYTTYVSKICSELWPYGLHQIGSLTFETAAYTARYILKKITGDNATDHYADRKPEYVTMSRRPGIASDWFQQFAESDVYTYDKVVVRHNFTCRPPKYYDRLYDLQQPEKLSQLKAARSQRAKNNVNNTPDRLEVRKKIQEIKQKNYATRNLETTPCSTGGKARPA
ncbi:MAG: replication initiator protein [Microvirus sp.]|nr:MAG: replication initiator protein [Microvirus sp.]